MEISAPEDQGRVAEPAATPSASSPVPEKRLVPFIYGVLLGFLADLVLVFLLLLPITYLAEVYPRPAVTLERICAFIFWLAFPMGAGMILVRRGKRYLGWGVFFSVYLAALGVLLAVLLAVAIAAIFKLV